MSNIFQNFVFTYTFVLLVNEIAPFYTVLFPSVPNFVFKGEKRKI